VTKARTNADNVTADIAGITAGTGITGGGTSGTVTITNDMATTIAAAGDLIYGTANDAYAALSLGTAGKVLKVNSGATAPEWAVDPTTDVVTTAGDLIYGTGADAVTRLGIGTAGQVLKVNSGATAPEWGSSGITWTYRETFTDQISSIAYNGSNMYVAVGNGGVLYSSPDAITWTSRTSGFGSNDIKKVAYGNGLWVAVGASGTLTTSSDGITWTARTANMSTNDIRNVVYSNSIWVAVGAGGGTTNTGGITYSTDGITWTRKSQSITVGPTYFDAVWNGTYWIVSGSYSTNNYLYASTPAGTWTAAAVGGSTISRNFWDGTRHIFYFEGGAGWYYSTSTTMVSPVRYIAVGAGMNNVSAQSYYYNNKVYTAQGIYATFTPASTNTVSLQEVSLSPTTRHDSSSSTFFAGSASSVFAGPAGVIITSGVGDFGVWTSF
jgi:hypothetical protein